MAREQRKLAAVVAADVVAYSRLMGRNENGALAAWPQSCRTASNGALSQRSQSTVVSKRARLLPKSTATSKEHGYFLSSCANDNCVVWRFDAGGRSIA
jgi:hypothetical protein